MNQVHRSHTNLCHHKNLAFWTLGLFKVRPSSEIILRWMDGHIRNIGEESVADFQWGLGQELLVSIQSIPYNMQNRTQNDHWPRLSLT